METLTVANSVVNVEDHHLFVYTLQKPIPQGKSCFLRLNPGSRIGAIVPLLRFSTAAWNALRNPS